MTAPTKMVRYRAGQGKSDYRQVRHDLGPGPARRAVSDRPYEWMTIGYLEFDGDSHAGVRTGSE